MEQLPTKHNESGCRNAKIYIQILNDVIVEEAYSVWECVFFASVLKTIDEDMDTLAKKETSNSLWTTLCEQNEAEQIKTSKQTGTLCQALHVPTQT